jgi:septal ring factor EnvC (AmiA/AmiB activator)
MALPLASVAAPSGSERLERLRQEIEEREARAREYADEAEGQLGELEAIDRELTETRRSVRRLRQRRRSAEEELDEARASLARAEKARESAEKDLNTRLVALYKFRSTGGLPALASAGDFQSFARLGRALEQVLEEDARLFSRYREAEGSWRESHDEAESLTDELALAGREISRREEATRRKLVERKNVVALLRSRANREQRAAGELREAARRLEETLRKLPGGGVSPGSGLKPGRVPRPTEGPIRLRFGRQVDPDFGTETLRTGVQIGANRGAPVRAVAPGRVLFAGWFRGYGQMVIIDHGKGSMTVSGYLEELAVRADDVVAGGHVIGAVGDTGALSGPGLYFEIRQDGVAVDPGKWFE